MLFEEVLPFDYESSPPFANLTPGRLVAYGRANPFSPMPSLSERIWSVERFDLDYQCPFHYGSGSFLNRREGLARKLGVARDPFRAEFTKIRGSECLGCKRMLYYHCCIWEMHFRCSCFGADCVSFYSGHDWD